MPSISFFRGALAALILSIAAAAIYFCATTLLDSALAIRLTMSAVTLGYLLVLLSNSEVSFGKVSFVSFYIVGAILIIYLWPSTLTYALYHVGYIWLVRTVYYHNSFLPALADLVYSVLSFTAALGAIQQSHSIFISFWSFFLAQALILPVLRHFISEQSSASNERSMAVQNTGSQQKFHQSHRTAQEALRKLASNT